MNALNPFSTQPFSASTHLYVLGADSITTAAPSVATTAISQNHVLGADGITTGVPVIDDALIAGTNQILDPQDITTGAPDVPTANMSEDETFDTANLFTGAPIVPHITFVQEHIFSAKRHNNGRGFYRRARTYTYSAPFNW